ncbi:Extensin-like protein C-terminus [Rhizobiales bacterium GAS188]|nr:Extensin-like protein C-terminus [Rhizobiales bacterium GAS188]
MAGGRTLRRRASLGAAAFIAVAIASCGKAPREARPAWRDEAERACLRSGAIRESDYITRAPAIDGPGACGALSPFHVAALSDGKVGLTLPSSLAGRGHKAYAATLTCDMVPALESWMGEKVQAAAAAVYGQPVVEMHTLGSYSCRRMNNGTGTSMKSEHAFADAIDVSGFTLADGREVMVRSGWRGAPQDQDFLRSVFVGSCEIFHTVLGPGSDGHHEDHFHLDLMRHASGHHICRPVIKFTPRSAAPLDAPVQPPVAPGQMQQEPEADDPYALEDMPPSRNAVASAAERPMEPAVSPRPMMASRSPDPQRSQPGTVAATPLPPSRSARLDPEDQGYSPPRISSKGDRLDRAGAAPSAMPAMQSSGGNTAVAKDASRLGAPDPSAAQSRSAQSRSAYAAMAPRPPAPIRSPSTPPGWSVGAQPVTRAAPMSLSGDTDPDE